MKFIRLSAIMLMLSPMAILIGACHVAGGEKETQTSFIDKKWQMQKFTVSPSVDWDLDGKQDTDIFALLEPCDQDDLLLLRSDGVVIRFAEKKRCDEEEADQKEDGTWTLAGNNAKIIFHSNGKKDEAKVLESSSKKLVLEHRFTSTDGIDHKLTAEYHLK